MFITLAAKIGLCSAIFVCSIALIFGEKKLKQASGVFLVLTLCAAICSVWLLDGLLLTLLLFDLSLLIYFISISWKSVRLWPYMACLSQAISAFGLVKPLIDERFIPDIAVFLVNFSVYLVLMSFLYGVYEEISARKKE